MIISGLSNHQAFNATHNEEEIEYSLNLIADQAKNIADRLEALTVEKLELFANCVENTPDLDKTIKDFILTMIDDKKILSENVFRAFALLIEG